MSNSRWKLAWNSEHVFSPFKFSSEQIMLCGGRSRGDSGTVGSVASVSATRVRILVQYPFAWSRLRWIVHNRSRPITEVIDLYVKTRCTSIREPPVKLIVLRDSCPAEPMLGISRDEGKTSLVFEQIPSPIVSFTQTRWRIVLARPEGSSCSL